MGAAKERKLHGVYPTKSDLTTRERAAFTQYLLGGGLRGEAGWAEWFRSNQRARRLQRDPRGVHPMAFTMAALAHEREATAKAAEAAEDAEASQ